jgi:hypothetical protein
MEIDEDDSRLRSADTPFICRSILLQSSLRPRAGQYRVSADEYPLRQWEEYI